MNIKQFTLLTLLSVFFLTSCGFKGAEEEARTTLNALYEARNKSGGLFQKDDYNYKYWHKIPKEKWEKLAKYLDASHGKLKEFKITQVKSNGRKKGLSAAGWVGFRIETKYEKGISGVEQVNFYRNGKGQPFLVEGHSIQSELLDKVLEAQKAQQNK